MPTYLNYYQKCGFFPVSFQVLKTRSENKNYARDELSQGGGTFSAVGTELTYLTGKYKTCVVIYVK